MLRSGSPPCDLAPVRSGPRAIRALSDPAPERSGFGADHGEKKRYTIRKPNQFPKSAFGNQVAKPGKVANRASPTNWRPTKGITPR